MIIRILTQDFNPRSREGSDGITLTDTGTTLPFQSTLPRRERPKILSHSKKSLIFQSTLPRRERLNLWTKIILTVIFQSTLPRRERLSVPLFATPFIDFNPRSREGSDKNGSGNWDFFSQFQSTLPRRERLDKLAKSMAIKYISIHAPAKGATKIDKKYAKGDFNFNPRSREGSD